MATLIAIPCMDMVHTGFMCSLMDMDKPDGTRYSVTTTSLIYDARNILASSALAGDFDRVLWLDSDMKLPKDALIRLSEDIDSGKEFVSGLYWTRKTPLKPCIYSDVWQKEIDGSVRGGADNVTDIPDDIFEIKGCGFGCVLTSTKLLKQVWENYGPPFLPMARLGEDLSFCWRVSDMGVKMYCDPKVKVGHIGTMVYEV